MNYSWRFTKLHCYPSKDGWNNMVFALSWNYIISDQFGNTTYISGERDIIPYDGSIPFVPKEELTNDILTSWIESSIPQDHLYNMQQALTNLLGELVNPSVVTYDVYI